MPALIDSEVQEAVKNGESFLTISDEKDLTKATAVLKGVKGLISKVKEAFDPIVEKAHKAHKEATAQRKKYLDPLETVVEKINASIKSFHVLKEAEAKELERKANEELALAAAKHKAELLQKAETVNEWEAEVLNDQAQAIQPVTVDRGNWNGYEKQSGLSVRSNWKARVVDASLVPREYLIVNESALNRLAKESKGTAVVPGVEFFDDKTVATRF